MLCWMWYQNGDAAFHCIGYTTMGVGLLGPTYAGLRWVVAHERCDEPEEHEFWFASF